MGGGVWGSQGSVVGGIGGLRAALGVELGVPGQGGGELGGLSAGVRFGGLGAVGGGRGPFVLRGQLVGPRRAIWGVLGGQFGAWGAVGGLGGS